MTTTQAANRLKPKLKPETVLAHIRAGNIEATWKEDQFGRGHYEITQAALKDFQDNRIPPGNPNRKKEKT